MTPDLGVPQNSNVSKGFHPRCRVRRSCLRMLYLRFAQFQKKKKLKTKIIYYRFYSNA